MTRLAPIHLPVLLLVLGAGRAWAAEVPFSTGHTINGDVDSVLAVDAADIDGDGDLDVFGGSFELAWWETLDGLGTSWTEHTIDSDANGASWVHATDVDGDGDLDVLWTTVGGTIRLSRNADGVGTSWTPRLINPATSHLANSADAADMDGDGDLDVLISAVVLGPTFDDNIEWWENVNGFASTNRHTIDGDLDGACGVGGACPVHGADVDGDGDIDVVGAKSEAGEIVWWENANGAGTSWTEHTIDGDFEGAGLVHAADVDGDGDIDAVGARSEAGEIVWWENLDGAGTSWIEHSIGGGLFNARSIHTADMDSDGDVDVLGVSYSGDDILWWENVDGAGTSWTGRTIDGDFDGAVVVDAGDVDGDGDLDVLGAAAEADDITWWENRTIHRSAVFRFAHQIDYDFPSSPAPYPADVDGDGDLDVVAPSQAFNAMRWWENPNVKGILWNFHTIDDDFHAAISAYAADVDRDGDIDVLGAARLGDEIAWWENLDGTGTSWTKHSIDAAFDGADTVRGADLDGDGDLDVLGATIQGGTIRWWQTWTARAQAGPRTRSTGHSMGSKRFEPPTWTVTAT